MSELTFQLRAEQPIIKTMPSDSRCRRLAPAKVRELSERAIAFNFSLLPGAYFRRRGNYGEPGDTRPTPSDHAAPQELPKPPLHGGGRSPPAVVHRSARLRPAEALLCAGAG